jgi:hypothetical protein
VLKTVDDDITFHAHPSPYYGFATIQALSPLERGIFNTYLIISVLPHSDRSYTLVGLRSLLGLG